MLSVKTPILAKDIHSVKELAPGHSVYRLDGWGDGSGKIDSIVIKLEESQNPQHVQAANMIMTVVDKNARTEVLSMTEIQNLQRWAHNVEVFNQDEFRPVNELTSDLRKQGAWVKMALKQLMTLDKAVDKRFVDPANPDKTDTRIIATGLRRRGGLEKLGEILAADLFNGNNDRIGYPNGYIYLVNDSNGGFVKKFNLKVISNVGNLFLACDGNGRGSPIGLDTFDPKMGDHHDLDTSRQLKGGWGGELFLKQNKVERMKYIANLVDDLETLLGGARNRKIPGATSNQLGRNRKGRIDKGLKSGEKKIQRAFRGWRRQAGGRQLKTHVHEKLSMLGWKT